MAIAPEGFYIDGESNSKCGTSVASGDVNSDGIVDILIGAPNYNNSNGRTYVIYGKSGAIANINLSNFTTQEGFYIDGESKSFSGVSVANAGDINGDGIVDIIIGAQNYDNSKGRTYVIYGIVHNCKHVGKLKLHNECLSVTDNTTCSTNLNASNDSTFATEATCVCTGKAYFPNGITAYSPIFKPTTPKCVTNCSDYYLSSIANADGTTNSKCATCARINPDFPFFDTISKSCVATCSSSLITDITNKLCQNCKDSVVINSCKDCVPPKTFSQYYNSNNQLYFFIS